MTSAVPVKLIFRYYDWILNLWLVYSYISTCLHSELPIVIAPLSLMEVYFTKGYGQVASASAESLAGQSPSPCCDLSIERFIKLTYPIVLIPRSASSSFPLFSDSTKEFSPLNVGFSISYLVIHRRLLTVTSEHS
jgi:hypothetical protein